MTVIASEARQSMNPPMHPTPNLTHAKTFAAHRKNAAGPDLSPHASHVR